MMKNIKDEWRNRIKSVLTTIIHSILVNNLDTKILRCIIIPKPSIVEKNILKTTIPTYDNNKQEIQFQLRRIQDVTEICVFEEKMSKRNIGKNITIQENNIIKFLDDNKIKNYEDSIIAFILANIEWK